MTIFSSLWYHRVILLAQVSSVFCLFYTSISNPWQTTDDFIVSLVLPFPEYHIIGIAQ